MGVEVCGESTPDKEDVWGLLRLCRGTLRTSPSSHLEILGKLCGLTNDLRSEFAFQGHDEVLVPDQVGPHTKMKVCSWEKS